VETGREGGGRQYYYLSPAKQVSGRNKIVGPDESVLTWDYKIGPTQKISKDPNWGKTPCDVKAWHNYLVAPGALHKTGRRYLPSVPLEGLTPEWFLKNLPISYLLLFEKISLKIRRPSLPKVV
jgi:hypothetical protein